jgi:predicted TIM-barrel fold metal-dependent hydrolase
MVAKNWVISADSHVLEPEDLWEKTLGDRYDGHIPKVVDGFAGLEGRFFYLGRKGEAARVEEMVDANDTDRRLADLAQAGKDPVQRLKMMDGDLIAAEVLNPTWGLWIPRILSADARKACAKVYNDWIAEYVGTDRKRLVGVALVPIDDVQWAVEELRRTAKRGLRGVMIGTAPPAGAKPYRDKSYDPFWAAACELKMPVTVHIVTGAVRDPFTYHGAEEREEVPKSFIDLFGEAAPVLANEFIFGGIFDRHPELKIFLSEYDASWLPILRYRVERIQRFPGLPQLKKKASAYLDDNIVVGIINDPLAQKMRHEIGVDRIMWGSDFPHPPCPYPRTHEKIEEITSSLTPEERRKITFDNVKKLYAIDA